MAQQLNVTAPKPATCGQVNSVAIQTAIKLMASTAAGNASLARHRSRGRKICLGDDFGVPGNIGPLFLQEAISIADNGSCLVVESLKLGPQPLDAFLFPGVHYCKLLPPSRVIDWMMIDSLKPVGGCENK